MRTYNKVMHNLQCTLKHDKRAYPVVPVNPLILQQLLGEFDAMYTALKLASMSCGFKRMNTAAQKSIIEALRKVEVQ
jgi:hypothetical protein